MTRDETVELLRIRWRLDAGRFDQDTADTWHEALTDLNFRLARHTMIDLCRAQDRVTFADFCQAVTPHRRRPYDETGDDWWANHPELADHIELDPHARPGRTPSLFADQVRAQLHATPKTDRP